MIDIQKAMPVVTPTTRPFWDGTAQEVLRFQRCTSCNTPFFYPRLFCPECGTEKVAWEDAIGKASLYTYVINYLPAPGFKDETPYIVAVVELDEGPRMMTRLKCIVPDPAVLELDMPLQVKFEQHGDLFIPYFVPEAIGDAA